MSEAFWDVGTSTPFPNRLDKVGRTSFFRWQKAESTSGAFSKGTIDWNDEYNRFRLSVVAGISIDAIPLSTAAILNQRILLTSANYLVPYLHRQTDLRIWALGRAGYYNTPYRYRVWRVWRIFAPSMNPEHQHGPKGEHSPRHDLAVIFSRDRMFVYWKPSQSYQYPYQTFLIQPHLTIIKTVTAEEDKLLYAGSGYEYMEHVRENYKIYFALPKEEHIVDCSKYLPKFWGKFICFKNVLRFSGIQNGGPLLLGENLLGVGCFEIRVNEDRIFAFTDLRYYVHIIKQVAELKAHQYYEYAYPQWGVHYGAFSSISGNLPRIPKLYTPWWVKVDHLG
ncbi:unnamed protein product [Pieris macdunnoughi]|nr:unnamed protein product [Pieris macdunnoughi]